MKKFLNEPIQSTLLGFSKVTNIFRDVLKPSEANNNNNNQNSVNLDSFGNKSLLNDKALNSKNKNKFNYNGDDMSDLMDSMTADNIHSTNNDGFEMVTKVELGPMPKVTRGLCVNKAELQFDKDGRVLDVDKLKSLIFRGVCWLNLFLYHNS